MYKFDLTGASCHAKEWQVERSDIGTGEQENRHGDDFADDQFGPRIRRRLQSAVHGDRHIHSGHQKDRNHFSYCVFGYTPIFIIRFELVEQILETEYHILYIKYVQKIIFPCPFNFLEPFDTASWMMVGVVAIQAATFSIFAFEWMSPSGFDMKVRRFLFSEYK